MQLYQLILIFISLVLISNINYTEPKKNIYKVPRVINSDKIKIKNKNIKFYPKSILKNNNLYKLLPNKNDTNPENEQDKEQNEIHSSDKILNIPKKTEIINPQIKLINELNSKEINKEYDYNTYWDNLNIGNFVDRDYLNIQVNEFNKFHSNNSSYSNQEISKVYDDLTNATTNYNENLFDDQSIANDKTKYIDGFSMNCKNLDLNNIEK